MIKISNFVAFVLLSIVSMAFAAPCVDDLEFMYKNNSAKNCKWVGNNADVRCNKTWEGKNLDTYCPDSCGKCSDSVAAAAPCVDADDLQYNNQGSKDCMWVGKKPWARCALSSEGVQLSTICPKSCNNCPGCKNDDDFRFKNQNGKHCNWVGRVNKNKRCKKKWEGKPLKEYCPLACDTCPTSSAPSATPSSSPTVSHSDAPSGVPSEHPTVSHSGSPSFSPSYEPSTEGPTGFPTQYPTAIPLR